MNEEELAVFVLVAFIFRPNKAEESNSQCQGFHQETPVKASCTAPPCQTRVSLLSTNYKDAMWYGAGCTCSNCGIWVEGWGLWHPLWDLKHTHMCLCLSLSPARYLQGTGPGSGFSHRAGPRPRCWFEPVTLMNRKKLKENVWELFNLQCVLQQRWLIYRKLIWSPVSFVKK